MSCYDFRSIVSSSSINISSLIHTVGSCLGDGGGPLYDSDNNLLVGVVSWGYGCTDASFPSVYSRISNQVIITLKYLCAVPRLNKIYEILKEEYFKF